MNKTWLLVVALMPFILAPLAQGETYKSTYPDSCQVVWGAVKATLNTQHSYNVTNADEKTLSANYQPKHEAHFDVSGVFLQRENHVRLVTRGPGCEMQVMSNYSGWGHNDKGDFQKRVDDALARIKAGTLVPPARVTITEPDHPESPASSGRPATSAKPAAPGK